MKSELQVESSTPIEPVVLPSKAAQEIRNTVFVLPKSTMNDPAPLFLLTSAVIDYHCEQFCRKRYSNAKTDLELAAAFAKLGV